MGARTKQESDDRSGGRRPEVDASGPERAALSEGVCYLLELIAEAVVHEALDGAPLDPDGAHVPEPE